MDFVVTHTPSTTSSSTGTILYFLTPEEKKQAYDLLKQEKFEAVLSLCTDAALAGDIKAMYFLGVAHKEASDKMFMGEFSYKAAEDWLMEASNKNLVDAKCLLGGYFAAQKRYEESYKQLRPIEEAPSYIIEHLDPDKLIEAKRLIAFLELFHLGPDKIETGKNRMEQLANQKISWANFYLGQHYSDIGYPLHGAIYYQREIALNLPGKAAAQSACITILSLEKQLRQTREFPLIPSTFEAIFDLALSYKKSGHLHHAVLHLQIVAVSTHKLAKKAENELQAIIKLEQVCRHAIKEAMMPEMHLAHRTSPYSQ